MVRSGFDFHAYISERTRDFTGREWLFATIDRWLTDPHAPRVFLLIGEPGIGKTAIAARLTQFSNGDVIPPADYACVGDGFLSAVHFCSARNGSWISPDAFARFLSAQLAARYPDFADSLASNPRIHIEQRVGTVSGTMIGVQITNYYAETSEALFSDLVRTPLQAVCSKNGLPGPLTILVDGLDESMTYSGRTNIVRMLAACWDLPPQVRLLLTSRPVDGVLVPFRPLQPFVLYARSEENRQDVGTYVGHRFATSAALRDQVGDEVQVERVRDSLVQRSGRNFLVVSKVLDGAERGELSLADPGALPADLQDLYAWFLDRLTRGDMSDWWDLYCPFLGILAVAQGPIDASTLCRWTGLAPRQIIKAVHSLHELLDPALDDHYRLYHESVADFLTGNRAGPYTLETAERHRQVAASYVERFLANEEAWASCDEYGLRYLVVHLRGAAGWANLMTLLTDFGYLEAKVRATSVYDLEEDYRVVLDSWNGTAQDRGVLQAFAERLRLESHHIQRAPELLFPHLYNHLTWLDSRLHALCERARAQHQGAGGAGWLRMTQDPRSEPPPWARPLEEHANSVHAVAVSPDGAYVVSGSEDNTVKVWELATGRLLRALEGHTDCVNAVAVSPDGTHLVSGSEDKMVKVWTTPFALDPGLAGERSYELFGNDAPIRSLALSPDGHWLVCGDMVGRVWVFEWVRQGLLTLALP